MTTGVFDNPIDSIDISLNKTNELLKLILLKMDQIEKDIQELKKQ